MPLTYDLTPTQRDAWRQRLAALFIREGNCLKLARKVWTDEKEIKNNGGYIGEFREGNRRALRYFLGDNERLRLLATALGCEATQLEGIWREVQGARASGDDTLFLPGFEDWGPVSLDDGFVPPSPRMEGNDPKQKPLRERFLASLPNDKLSVTGPRGSGVTTLLRRLATWAQEDGWRVAWGWDGQPPDGRAVLLVLDTHHAPSTDDLQAWGERKGNAMLRGLTGPRQQNSRDGLFNTPWSSVMRIQAVDEGWVGRLIEVLRRIAPKAESRRLAGIQPTTTRSLLARVPFPTPELVGCLLRAHLDGFTGEIAEIGPRLVLESARRRLVGKGRREDGSLLRGFESWVRAAYPNSLLHPSQPVDVIAEDALLSRARAVVDNLGASAEDRDLLRAVLPLATGAAVVEALTATDVIREDAGGIGHFRYVPFLSPAVAMIATGQPEVLRSAMIHHEHGFLLSVSAVRGGPEALAGLLRSLSEPAFATAIRHMDAEVEWLRKVSWDPGLVARALAVLLIKGVVSARLPSLFERRGGRSVGFWPAFEGAPQLPAVQEIQAALLEVASGLRIQAPEVSDAYIAMVLAYLRPTVPTLLSESVWPSRAEAVELPAHWIALLSESRDGLLFLTDPTRSGVATKLLSIKAEKGGTRSQGDTTHPRWLPLIEKLANMDAEAAAGVLCRMFDAVVVGTQALRGQVLDRRELSMLSTRLREDANRGFAKYLSGLAVALQSPLIRRHRRAIAGPLKQSLAALDAIALDPELPVDAWVESSFQDGNRDHTSLARVLSFLLTSPERVARLRTVDGYLSPFWSALIQAGVLIEESLRLLDEVESGRVPYRPGRGTPSAWEVANFERNPDSGPKTTVAGWIRHAILREATPSEIAKIPGFPDPGGSDLPGDALISQYDEGGGRVDNVREYFWLFVRSLDERSLLWRLLAAKELYDVQVEALRDVGVRHIRDQVPDADTRGIKAAIALVPDANLDTPHWEILANAALLTRLDGRVLAPLLASIAAIQARSTLVVELLLRILADDPTSARDWLRRRLAEGGALVDTQPFAAVWLASGIDTDEWRQFLAKQSQLGPCGTGLIPALVQAGQDDFAFWLGHDHLRDAALAALTTLPDWPERLSAALSNTAVAPSASVLAHIMHRKDRAWLAVLDDSSRDWALGQRMGLWSRALSVATFGWQRDEIWQRMAVLGG